MSLKEQAVIAMIKECIQPLLELKKGFEKQENRADDITEGLPVEKYPSVNAVINFVKTKINEFSNSLNTVYIKLSEFNEYKETVDASINKRKSELENYKTAAEETFTKQSEFKDYKKTVENTFNEKQIAFDELKTDLEVTESASGSAITIESANAPLQNLKLYGYTEQNGTPTPDAPIPLVSVGDSGSFDVGIYGGNLINEAHFAGSNGTDYAEFVNGKIHFVNASGNAFTCASITLKLPKGTYYLNMKVHSHTTPSAPVGIGTTTEQQYINGKDANTIKYVFDKPTHLNIKLTTQGYKEIGEYYANVWLVAENNSDYQPYVAKQSLTIPYTLRKFDGATDEIDFAKGVLIQRCYLATDFSYNFSLENVSVYKANKPYPTDYDSAMCSHTNMMANTNDDNTHFYIGSSAIWAYLPKDVEATNIQVLCKLETPLEIPLSETELNDYRQLYTNKGTTNILSEADAEVEYYRNTPNAQAIGNIHSRVNADYFKLQQAIISTGGN